MYPLDGRCSTLASSAALSRARNKCRTAPRLLAIVLVLVLALYHTYLSSSSTTYPAHTATPRTARRAPRADEKYSITCQSRVRYPCCRLTTGIALAAAAADGATSSARRRWRWRCVAQ
ncbi:hypothetical protein OH76DRAFT_1201669 [Lentinus brumalis]|uniref:Uncharacterized protein n=1 Tax=Lentinus brumalis TaxID=2498619 RepID=A0A371CT59_9APHY|nr:hypothetical protein OH76DRAFT_1201669 [Polyporus brumalis]